MAVLGRCKTPKFLASSLTEKQSSKTARMPTNIDKNLAPSFRPFGQQFVSELTRCSSWHTSQRIVRAASPSSTPYPELTSKIFVRNHTKRLKQLVQRGAHCYRPVLVVSSARCARLHTRQGAADPPGGHMPPPLGPTRTCTRSGQLRHADPLLGRKPSSSGPTLMVPHVFRSAPSLRSHHPRSSIRAMPVKIFRKQLSFVNSYLYFG